jgi:dephospho-CoA kinase
MNSVVVGLTGQTGAGKSTVSKFFADSGYTIINADLIAREVMDKGTECLAEVVGAFGDKILREDGSLDRKALASIVFSDKKELERLDSISYPHITRRLKKLVDIYSAEGKKFILLDAPTLFESKSYKFCNLIVSVVAPPEIREQRIIMRDGITPEQARMRMGSQHSEEFFRKHSDFIICNDGSEENLKEVSADVIEKINTE